MLARRPTLAALLFFSAIASAIAIAPPVRGADFRVDNVVCFEGESRPQSQGVTIFCKGVVYDFVNDPAEIIVFDKDHHRFILLDPGRHEQCEVTTEKVIITMEQIKKVFDDVSKPRVHWLFNPTFDETLDRQNSQLTLRNEWLTYQAKLLPTGPGIAAQYREFCDWSAQFNHAVNESRPPYARMKLDEALERNHSIAKEVRLTTDFNKTPGPATIVSRHQLAAQLDSSDAKRIAEVDEDMKTFEHVLLSDYVQRK